MSKTGGGRGTNQHKIKGTSQAKKTTGTAGESTVELVGSGPAPISTHDIAQEIADSLGSDWISRPDADPYVDDPDTQAETYIIEREDANIPRFEVTAGATGTVTVRSQDVGYYEYGEVSPHDDMDLAGQQAAERFIKEKITQQVANSALEASESDAEAPMGDFAIDDFARAEGPVVGGIGRDFKRNTPLSEVVPEELISGDTDAAAIYSAKQHYYTGEGLPAQVEVHHAVTGSEATGYHGTAYYRVWRDDETLQSGSYEFASPDEVEDRAHAIEQARDQSNRLLDSGNLAFIGASGYPDDKSTFTTIAKANTLSQDGRRINAQPAAEFTPIIGADWRDIQRVEDDAATSPWSKNFNGGADDYGFGETTAETSQRRYDTHADAVQREILEVLGDEADNHDLDAIAERIITRDESGSFAVAEDPETFWSVVAANQKQGSTGQDSSQPGNLQQAYARQAALYASIHERSGYATESGRG
ncbi:hypothetical protein [Nesterenkonia rhizosphaerae]|uniref:Uncharacterized protein n=1 Tax=Nesterenkonia rhizosphaerae TaxID=1348272 RepID=A0ABP9FZQ9_9MICC